MSRSGGLNLDTDVHFQNNWKSTSKAFNRPPNRDTVKVDIQINNNDELWRFEKNEGFLEGPVISLSKLLDVGANKWLMNQINGYFHSPVWLYIGDAEGYIGGWLLPTPKIGR